MNNKYITLILAVLLGTTIPLLLASSYPARHNDFMLDVARGQHHTIGVNKFGRTENVDNGISTDVWDRANPTDDQDIWIAPTVARVHQIVSSSASDDGSPVGVGARTLRVFGLTSWDADGETTEDITLNGTTNVATSNSYVIIYRLAVLTKGATSANVGTITATADTDATVTAQIQPSAGDTQMAIFGVSSKFDCYLISFYGSVQAVSSGKEIKITLLVNPEPDAELTNFLTRHTFGIGGSGTTAIQHMFKPYVRLVGPGIFKVNVTGDADNMDVSAGFDIILIRK